MVAEACVVELRTIAGGGDNHAAITRKLIKEWAATRGATDDGQRAVNRFQPAGQLGRRAIVAAKVELRRLAVKRAVANEDQPDHFGRGGRDRRQSLLEQLAIAFFLWRAYADHGELCIAFLGGGLPARTPVLKLLAKFLRPFRANNN